MQFQKTEWYLLIFAAFTVALIYNGALRNLLTGIFAGATGLLSKVMGQNSAGNFQKPF